MACFLSKKCGNIVQEQQEVDMHLGEKLRALREMRGLTYRKLGDLADVDYAWLCRLERGQAHNLSLDAGKRLALALGVTLDYLAGMDEARLAEHGRPARGREALSCKAGAPGPE
jgi:transcriptional regulator with XRE-family HTH domain